MDKEHIKWLKSLAALLNEKESVLVEKAKLVQPSITKLDEMKENTYYFLVGSLLGKHEIGMDEVKK